MKAVQIHSYGPPEVLVPTDVASPDPGPGQILIKVESAAVNFSDVMRRRNDPYPFPTPLPFVPGGEVAGVVAALGDGISSPPIGTPVFALVGADGSGGYAEYAVADAPQVVPIPAGLGPDQAAALVIAGATAMLTLTQAARLQPGESVLIPAAAGGVGSYAVQLAKLLGAGTVIAAAGTPAKQKLALALGADAAVDYTAPDWPEQVRELTDGRGADVVLEMSGGRVFTESLACLAPFGRAVVYGMAGGEPLRLDDETVRRFFYAPALNQSLIAFNVGVWFFQRPEVAGPALQQLVGHVAAGEIDVQVGQVLPLADAAEAHRLLETRQATGKLILKPGIVGDGGER